MNLCLRCAAASPVSDVAASEKNVSTLVSSHENVDHHQHAKREMLIKPDCKVMAESIKESNQTQHNEQQKMSDCVIRVAMDRINHDDDESQIQSLRDAIQEMTRSQKIDRLTQSIAAPDNDDVSVGGYLETGSKSLPPKTKDALLVVGGINYGGGDHNSPADDDTTTSLELIDLTTPPHRGWRTVEPIMPIKPERGRIGFAVAVMSNRVYLCGGISWVESSQQSCINYDPISYVWNTTGMADMHERRMNFALASSDGQTLYAVGGLMSAKSVECYSTATRRWTRKGDAPISLIGHAMVALNGYLYTAGGQSYDSHKLLHQYDPVSDTWRRLPDLPSPRKMLSFVAVPPPPPPPSSSSSSVSSSAKKSQSGFLYVIGGHDGFQEYDSVMRFNIATNRWETDGFPGTRQAGGVYLPSAVLLGSHIYAVGGVQLDSSKQYKRINTIQSLSLSDHHHRRRSDSSSSSSHLNVDKLNHFLPSTVKWVKLNHTMIKPRSHHFVVTVQILV